MSEGNVRSGGGGSSPIETNVAKWLLDIGVVSLSPHRPYTWASGVSSPVYCDCRRIMSFPAARSAIEGAWASLIRETWPDAKVLVGVATGGIPHAAFVAERLGLPMAYIRPAPKGHGLGKRLEGVVENDGPAVIMEDLVSTGSSLLDAVRAAQAEGVAVLGATAVFTYGLPESSEAFQKAGVRLVTLTNLFSVMDRAGRDGRLSEEERHLVTEGMASVIAQLASRKR